MSSRLGSSLFPFFAILGSVTFLALGTSWAKLSLFPLLGAQGTTAVRVGLSAVVLMLWWRPWRRPLSRADLRAIALYGSALGGMNLAFYLSIQTLPFGLAVAIELVGPLGVAVYASRRWLDGLWVGCAVASLSLLLPWGHDVRTLDPGGVGYAMAAAALWATYIVFGKRAGHLPTGQSVPFGLAMAALVVVPVGVAHAGAAMVSWQVLGVGVCVAVLSSAIPISLEMLALQRLPKQAFGVMISMEPAVTALVALVLLGEHLTLPQWLAIALIMGASMGCAATSRPTAPVGTPPAAARDQASGGAAGA